MLVATALPMFMATLDNLVMTNALPVLHAEFGASVEELQWFMNAYTLAFASTILMAVALGDRFGRRTLFLIGIIVFTLSSALAALATDPGQLIAARALQGFGAAAILPLSLTLLAGNVPLARRPLAIGIWGGVAGLGVATGPLIGGAVIEGWAWQAIFWINVPVGVVSVALALIALPNSFGAKLRADIVGLVLSGLGLLGLVYGIVRGNDAGWDSTEVLGALIAGGVLLVAFVLWEWRAKAPLLPLRLFRDRSFTVANVVGLGFSFGAFGSVFILIQFLQVVQGSSPLEAAWQTSPWTLAPMVVAPLAGFVAPRVGTRTLIVAGLTFLGVALFWLTDAARPRHRVLGLRRAVHPRGRRHGTRVRAVVDGRARDHGTRRPCQGQRHELDAARGRRRTRHRGVDRGVHGSGRRADADGVQRRRRACRARGRRSADRDRPRRPAAAVRTCDSPGSGHDRRRDIRTGTRRSPLSAAGGRTGEHSREAGPGHGLDPASRGGECRGYGGVTAVPAAGAARRAPRR